MCGKGFLNQPSVPKHKFKLCSTYAKILDSFVAMLVLFIRDLVSIFVDIKQGLIVLTYSVINGNRSNIDSMEVVCGEK